ncbi:tyrosine-type recombinase/integrase [Cryobacterium aureum]|uniref:tyrosine-type recombinase/integrase n=1 Tax=Cryobacterium aureum TaxID=995037 RepID=UPI000CF48244|nr:tyrosine-type recombinase/integrase [Cryobacterium aureum]
MSEHGFTSVFAADLEGYLAFKSSMGCYGASRIWYLKQFDRYCADHSLAILDRATIEGWVTALQSSRPGPYRSWMSYIRDFGRWAHINGNDNAYVLSDHWKASFVRSQPYLLADAEIRLFFQAAARIEGSSPWTWQAVAFFALMHSCGLRTGEVRHLTPHDVHLDDGVIEVLASKGHRDRRLPLTGELVELLAGCDARTRGVIAGDRASFFVMPTGKPVTPVAVGIIFNRIWDKAALTRTLEGKRPRPYDFRHHFAYANLQRWMTDGTDVNAMLPYLARYMGHASLDSTYYYVHTSPDFMDSYTAITRDSDQLLPEVGF